MGGTRNVYRILEWTVLECGHLEEQGSETGLMEMGCKYGSELCPIISFGITDSKSSGSAGVKRSNFPQRH
jgi:hypothetical protein